MHYVLLLIGCLVIGAMLWDAFETIALPRTATRRLRLSRLFYRITWSLWAGAARRIKSDRRREHFLAGYGPLSVFGLLGVWAAGLIAGFALLLGSQQGLFAALPSGSRKFDLLYVSGSTLFTLGVGDVAPHDRIGRILMIVEGGIGLGLLTLVLSYLPVLYGSFSRREVRVTLLDVWAGSPPAAAEILRRLAQTGDPAALDEFLKDWEYWCSELLESHLSYPAVAYFRSQHQRQSWVSALTTVLDVSALLAVGIDRLPTWRAQGTFAIARHTVVDLSHVLGAPLEPSVDRLPPAEFAALQRDLEGSGLLLTRTAEAIAALTALRRSYEPYAVALATRLMTDTPCWRHQGAVPHNWRAHPLRDVGAHL